MKEHIKNLKIEISNIKIIETISKNQFSEVNKIILNQTYYVISKKFRKDSSNENILLFKNEFESLSILNHPNIIKIKFFSEDNENFYLFFEEIGENLFNFIKKNGKISENMTKKIFKQIVEGLHHIHESNIAHNDLKPENILILDNYRILIIDFGYSYHLKNNYINNFMGSIEYSSPERLKNIPHCGKKSDIWSLGIILFNLLTGYYPWTINENNKLIEQILEGNYLKLQGFSYDCIKLYEDLLNYNPLLRPNTNELLKNKWIIKKNIIKTNLIQNNIKRNNLLILKNNSTR